MSILSILNQYSIIFSGDRLCETAEIALKRKYCSIFCVEKIYLITSQK